MSQLSQHEVFLAVIVLYKFNLVERKAWRAKMADCLGPSRQAGWVVEPSALLHRDCNDRRWLIGHIVGLDGSRVRCWADLPYGQCSRRPVHSA